MKLRRDADVRRQISPYERFMKAEGVPVHRGIAINRLRALELAPWKRTGGRGAFIQLTGTEDAWGMYLVEIPPGGALEVERHLYHETLYALEGAGVTELWENDEKARAVFEWEAGTLFSIQLNSLHRISNSSLVEPALLLAGTTAPGVINLFADIDFVFGCPYPFGQPAFEGPDEADSASKCPTPSVMPGLVDLRLPRAPGSKHERDALDLELSSGFRQVLIEQSPGSYAPARTYPDGTVFICLSGEGYSYGWQTAVGERPWQQGEGDRVRRQGYMPGSVVSAAPAPDGWFHQDFALGNAPLRLLAWLGPPSWPASNGRESGRRERPADLPGLPATGPVIPQTDEDPKVKRNYLAQLERRGGTTAPRTEQSAFGQRERAAGHYRQLRLTQVRVEIAHLTRATFERVKFERFGAGYREAGRTVLYESEELVTPYLASGSLQVEELSRFLSFHQELAGLQPEQVDIGMLLMTGAAAVAADAASTGRTLADELGPFVAVHLAAHDSSLDPELQLTGDSIFASDPGILPLYDVPLVNLDPVPPHAGKDELKAVSVRPAETAKASGPIAVAWRWRDCFASGRVDTFLSLLEQATEPLIASGRDLILLNDGDIGGLAGLRLRDRLGSRGGILSLDGLTLPPKSGRYTVDVGRFLVGSGAVPVNFVSRSSGSIWPEAGGNR